jgi:hypothetical protein
MDKFSADERRSLADLLEAWLIAAGISTIVPPMMGEEDEFGD